MTTICCKCFKTKTANGWTKRVATDVATLSHGYCPTCYREAIKKIENYRHRPADQPTP